jgi:protein-S-isoprenylcysteine O-methyltransferase Ste14
MTTFVSMRATGQSTPPAAPLPASAYVQSAIFVVLTGVALFASAGTVAIPGFWAYLVIEAAAIVAALLWLDADLLRERQRPGGGKQPIALKLLTGVLFLHWIAAGLDRGRFHFSDAVPEWLRIAGLTVFAAGYALFIRAMLENRFFSSVVRIQADRGQHVISSGPYAAIRHPGYLAGILIILSSGVGLGSWLAAAIVCVTMLPFLLYRTVTEDRVLQDELAGYRDYAARVHWRLMPGLW